MSEDILRRCIFLKADKLSKQKADLDNQVKDLQERLEDEENTNSDLTNQKRKLESEIQDMKTQISQTEQRLQKSGDEGKTKDHQINQLKDELMKQEQANIKLTSLKKEIENQHQVRFLPYSFFFSFLEEKVPDKMFFL